MIASNIAAVTNELCPEIKQNTAAGENKIPTDDAIEFAERARAVGVDVELRSVPDGQHIFCLGPAGVAWMRCLGRRYAQ